MENKIYNILAVNDEQSVLDLINKKLNNKIYKFTGINNPLDALELLKAEHFDLLILDFLMEPINGDELLKRIREFDKNIYVILLMDDKNNLPPNELFKTLDIQGYCEKDDTLEQLILWIESGIKSINQMNFIKRISAELSKTYTELESAYLDVIETLRYTVEAKDPYTRGHSDRVSAISVLIGEKMDLKSSQLKSLKIGGLFHDIGKIGIPDSILLKSERLTDDEYTEIQNHPAIGTHILSTAKIFKNILPIVQHHHEKYDGTGYPGKLAGESIPLLARIVSVADSFDAMASRRPYRYSLSVELIKREISAGSGKQFDPDICKVFLDILENDFNKISAIQDKF